MRKTDGLIWVAALLGFGWPAEEAGLEILLPLGRTAYQTNEAIEFAVVRSGPGALPAGGLGLSLTGPDGSAARFTFPVASADRTATEHLRLNGRLLRPGSYALEASSGGASARKEIQVVSHVRKSSFRTIDWGCRAKPAEQAAMGEDSVGFNLLYAAYGGLGADESIRGGLDYMWCCTMGGGHQMDLRLECDWSDPYALQGGVARVAQRAFRDRTHPNAVGVHFYDEPGLTWWKHPKTGEMTPHDIPAQGRAYRSAFGRDPLAHTDVRPENPEHDARWKEWGRWKLSFMDAAWKRAAAAVRDVDPEMISATQSVYGWNAYADGYYFNVARSLPVLSGHGGYDDYGGGYYNPLFTFEAGRMRELRKPNWYLPTWYGNTPPDRYRLEQYACFIQNLQGMAKPPDMQVHRPSACATSDGIVETNQLMLRLGTVFTTMPVTRPPTAVLYSMSQNLHAQLRDMRDNYEGGGHRDRLYLVWLAGLRLQTPILPIVEEDVVDGTLAAHHKAVVLAGIHALEPRVVAALEAFAAGGGAVILTDDCRVRVKGAATLGAAADRALFEQLSRAWREKKLDEHARLNRAGNYLKAAEPIARALGPKLAALGIAPVLGCDNPEIIAARQASGDVEYFFAVNASYDAAGGHLNSIKPGVATITIPGIVYDAVRGGAATLGTLRFGPGQMRAFARTARPVGGVQVLPPVVHRDLAAEREPLRVEVGAILVDDRNRILAGSAPLHVRVTDPLGTLRHEAYRATERGVFRMSLPLAVNDPAGAWTVTVRELLDNREAAATFTYTPPRAYGALAGAVARAVSFGPDRDRVFRFFRTHRDVTIVCGSSPHHEPAAERLAEALKPWGVRFRTMPLSEAAKPRPVAAEEAPTWCGLHLSRVQPGDKNNPAHVGFAVQGPVVLLGTPEDHPIVKFALDQGFLPYRPDRRAFPGRGRGMLAWQRDAVGYGQESVTLLAYDAAGMAEAVGSLYEAAAGLEPLTALVPPSTAEGAPANAAPARAPEAAVAWTLALPDRAAAIRESGGTLYVLTKDGSLTAVDAAGKVSWQRTFDGGETWGLDVSADGARIAAGASRRLLAFDARGKPLFDVAGPEVTFVAASPQAVAAGGADGSLSLYGSDGGKLWTIEGPAEKKNVQPYVSGVFSADGKTLVACTAQQAHVVVDGKIAHRIGGVAGTVAPARSGDEVVVSGGNGKVLFLSPAQGKVVRQVAAARADVVSLSGSVVGTEADGGVLGLAGDKAGWEHRAAGRLTKKVAAREGAVGVAYWGGTVGILDGKGTLLATRRLPGDVTDLAWAGGRLVAGLADGRLLALETR
jgi:outer membrane protein assembly factor BamB